MDKFIKVADPNNLGFFNYSVNYIGTKKKVFLLFAILFIVIFFFIIKFLFANNYQQIEYADIIYQEPEIPAPYRIAKGKLLHINSGTGFFVNNDSIITNAHVLESCKSIRIRGAIGSCYADLVNINKQIDLARLKTSCFPNIVAHLRGLLPLQKGQEVKIMGYPLESGINGSYVLKTGTIINFENDAIEFTDVVAKGNSGGPLLDNNGVVVGVIFGKIILYSSQNDVKLSQPKNSYGIAINLQNLKNFLAENNIVYFTDDTSYNFPDSDMEDKAKNYIVNIQCVQDEAEITN